MVRRGRFGVALVVAAALVFAGCSSSGDPNTAADAPDVSGDEVTTTTSEAPPRLSDEVALPIVFVHGFAGSAQQYESQAMRFVANGYPEERIVAYDHDGAGLDIDGFVAGLDAVVDRTLEELGAEKVHLVGHSRGTGVSSRYLSDPARAAKVEKYVAIDGAPCPDVVPCIAPTQVSLPGQAHVEAATSPESFAMQFEFLVGTAPDTVEIVPQEGTVEISGRAVNFPSNVGRGGDDLDIWAIDGDTGQRIGDEPHASVVLGPDGEFGPIELESGAHYEYVLSSDTSDVEHHLYLQPYVRDSRLVRLLSSEPDSVTRTNTNSGPGHSALVLMRMREWYAADRDDVPGDQRDQLTVEVVGETEPVDVLGTHVGNATIGIHVHDDVASVGETTAAPLPFFDGQPFQSGTDVFLPASPDGSGTIRVVNVPRGDASRRQTVNVPNWPSDLHAVSVVFADHPLG